MGPIWLTALLASWASASPQDVHADEAKFFVVADAHYVVLDQRGEAPARELANLLEEAFVQFDDLLRARPRVKRKKLRVEVFGTRGAWMERLQSLDIDPEQVAAGHYDPNTGAVILAAQDTAYRTRARLLSAGMRQFHHRAKAKNDDLLDHWFVVGLSEFVAMHTWDGEHLQIGAELQLAGLDTPALALDALQQRPANMERFTGEVLASGPMAWTLTAFLLRGQGGKHRRRFERLALGHRGSMIDGEQLALSLGPPGEIMPTIEDWLGTAQLPLEVLGGDFEDHGAGRLVGTACSGGTALAFPKAPVRRLRCRIELRAGQAAGLVLDYQSPRSFSYALLAHGNLWSMRVQRGAHEQTDRFRQPRARGGRVEFEARREDGLVELFVNGESLGSIGAAHERLGLVVRLGEVTFTEVEWE